MDEAATPSSSGEISSSEQFGQYITITMSFIDLYKSFLQQTIQDCSFDQNLQIRLCVALSNAYTDVIRDPERACNMLQELQAELKEEEVHPRLVDKLNLELWKAYRYAAYVNTTD